MSKKATLAELYESGLIAVLRGPSPELTLDMVAALVDAGLRAIEITYSTPDATSVVEQIAGRYADGLLLGMGTLREPKQAEDAEAAGAQFIVSPHLDPELADAMIGTGLVTMFGALTPSEVVQAHRIGSDVVKLFPGSLGGPPYLKALRGPLPDIEIMPTGGVSLENAGDWIAAGAFAVGAGSQLCPTEWARQGRFDEIRKRAAAFLDEVQSARARA